MSRYSFLPEFLAKNKVPGSLSPVIVIPALTSILCEDDEDRFLCPVRALKQYLTRTRPFRGKYHRRLFISYNPDYTSDISLQSLSRWIMWILISLLHLVYMKFALGLLP